MGEGDGWPVMEVVDGTCDEDDADDDISSEEEGTTPFASTRQARTSTTKSKTSECPTSTRKSRI